MLLHRLGLLVVLGGACLPPQVYRCEDGEQCTHEEGGRCEISGWCAYPDASCASGRAYGPFSDPALAGQCVEDVPAADAQWTAMYDGPEHQDDRAFGVAVDPQRDAFYVTGFSTATARDVLQQDILIQRWSLSTGALVWSILVDGGHGDDRGEDIALTADGSVVVAAEVETESGESDGAVLVLDPDGREVWRDQVDFAEKAAGVAIDAEGRIVVGGKVGFADAASQGWTRWYTADRSAVEHEVIEAEPQDNEVIDVVAGPEGGIQVTGYRTTDEEQALWTARYDRAAQLQWEYVVANPDPGNATRGVGQAFDASGGSAVTGVVSNDIFVQRYAADGTPNAPIFVSGSQGAHDEGADVAFLPDGSFFVVGFVDFRTDGDASGDIWMRRYSPDGVEAWTREIDGPGRNLDKALAVALAPDLTAVVVGYATIPGQSRDLWLGRVGL